MTAWIGKGQPFLALCVLLSTSSAVFGGGGPQGHMQQNFHASRQAAITSSAPRRQHPTISRPFSSTVHKRQSGYRMHTGSLGSSQSGRLARQSVHVRPIPASAANARVGIHDFGSGMGLQRQGPWAGRGGEFGGVFAMEKRSQAAARQRKERLAAGAAAEDRERPDRLVGRAGARFSQQQRANFSAGRERSGMNSSPSMGRR